MPNVARYMMVSATVLTSVDILTAYLPVLGSSVGIAPVMIGGMLAVRGVSSTLSRLAARRLARRFSQSALIVASVLGTALCLVAITVFPAPVSMFVALAVGGFFLGIGQPLTMTAVAVSLPAPARSSGLALRLLGNRVAQTATPLIAGAITAVFGIASVFIVQVLGLAVSAAWELGARRRSAADSGENQTG
ncbi:MFS transporter [Microbacterium elymi]|uniref:MFS transporter n=1 Tax=Microbacterium elymi TaxID=2909587 RepID=A0ABY5NHP8_9MICO|nr:MFS transporter [Microbacterium elymi]UUT34673.1 MFS transporter [Microbacterium elymi]